MLIFVLQFWMSVKKCVCKNKKCVIEKIVMQLLEKQWGGGIILLLLNEEDYWNICREFYNHHLFVSSGIY